MVGAFNESRPIAQTSFYETYRPIVEIRVQEKIGDLPGYEDVVNDIFLEMFKKGPVFQTLKNVENYLKKVIWSECKDFKKKNETPVIKMDNVLEFNQRFKDRAVYLEEVRMKARTLHDMALEILSPQCKEVFLMFYIRGYRHKEIARLLGISERTVERHMEIARARLRMEVKKGGGRMYFIQVLLPVLWAQLNA